MGYTFKYNQYRQTRYNNVTVLVPMDNDRGRFTHTHEDLMRTEILLHYVLVLKAKKIPACIESEKCVPWW